MAKGASGLDGGNSSGGGSGVFDSSALGDNKIKIKGDIKDFAIKNEFEAARIGKPYEGTYQVLANHNGQDVREQRNGIIVQHGKRVYGITKQGDEYFTTDLQSGMLINSTAQSFYRVMDAILLFQDHLAHENNKKLLKTAIGRFSKAKAFAERRK